MKVKLGDVCDKGTSGIAQKDLENCTGDYPIYGAAGFISNVDFYQQEKPYIAVVKDGAGIGRIMKLPAKSSVIGTMQYILPNEKVDISYLAYAMEYMNLAKYYTGATIPHIYFRDYKKEEINLIDLNEQRHIAAVLDKVSDLIALRKKQLAKLDELVKARFVEMFGINTRQVPLTDYVWFQEGPGVRSVDFVDKGTILLTGSNINNNTISFGHKSDRFIAYELSSGKYAHFMCDKDDILVVSSAIDPDKFDKKVVVVDCNKKYCLNTGIIRFKLSKGHLTTGYFREFLKSDYFKYQVNGEMRGIAQMHFGPSHLKRMNILLPESIEIQDSFELFVQQTDKIKLLFQQGLEKLETLKKSLMQEYFG